MNKTTKTPDCPSCGSNRSVYEEGQRGYFCWACRVEFDNLPDEGGTYYNDPAKRAELADERAKRKRQEAERRLPPGFRFSGRVRR